MYNVHKTIIIRKFRAGAHINNLLTVVVWKCVYDRIVYIVKKGINIFF